MWDYYDDADEYISPKFSDKSSYTPYYLVLPIRVGYKLGINEKLTVNFAIGPSVGVGLWGKGHVKTYDESSNSELTSSTNLSNIFDTSKSGYMSSSRFEYGASVKAGVEIKRHYTIGIEYNLKHVAGKYKVISNLDVFSLNIGYKF